VKDWPTRIRCLRGDDAIRYERTVVDDVRVLLGQAQHGKRIIRIATRLEGGRNSPATEIFDGILHETIHALFNELPLLHTCVNGEREEEFIGTLSTALGRTLVASGIVTLPKTAPKEAQP